MSDIDQPEGQVSDQSFMNPDDVRGENDEELEWPEPQEEGPNWEEPGESQYNDGTPGSVLVDGEKDTSNDQEIGEGE